MKLAIPEFEGIAANRRRWIEEWKRAHGRKVVACLPMYVPEEIIHAAGMLPVVLQGSDETVGPAHRYVHAYLCHPIRSNFDVALRGELDFADGLVIPDLCDQAKRVGSLWRLQRGLPFFHYLSFPKMLDAPGSREFLVEELARYRRAAEKCAGRSISDEALRQSIKLYNQTRRLLSMLYELQEQQPETVPADEVAAVVTAAMTMPKEDFNPLLSRYLDMKRASRLPAGDGVRLVLTGNPCEDVEPGLLELLAELGGLVVADDLYPGQKYLGGLVAEEGDPLASLANAYFADIPCPTKNQAGRHWASHVAAQAQEARAKGVLVLLPKFCEIYAFEYPGVAQRLTDAGIPHLLLETDHSGVSGPLKTRLQAFVEMLKGE